MQVLSRCPLEVGSILWLPRPSAYTLTVVAKATFRLAPEVSQLAEEQDPVTEADSHWDHDEGKSLAVATDLAPRKRHPEVLLTGHAYAPKGTAVGALVARLTVCEIDKAIDVSGDRHFSLDGTLSHPSRFAKMPLRWERAAGGPETSNPVGVPMGEEARPDGWGRVPVPNLVPAGRLVASREDVVPPACFAPIAPAWPSRVTRLHRHGATFLPHGWHARPMPPDFDMAYFNAAPPDQHLRELVGTERMTLENLHPRYPLLTTRLTNVAPRATVDWGGGSSYEVPLACDTLLIDTDRCVATLTFRAEVPLDYPERQGWVIVTSDTLATPEIPAWIHSVKDPNETMAQPSHVLAAPALPFDDGGATGALPAFDPSRAALPFEVLEPIVEPDPDVEPLDPAGDDADYDEEETFASVRGDAPFPVGARPPVVVTGGDAAPSIPRDVPPASAAPAVPPKVPQGPRLGAFRLQAKSDAPSAPAPPELELDGSTTGPQPAVPRTSDAAMPFVTTPPGKVLPGKIPPGTIAPLKPGVPPPPPSTAGREPPTFGFGRPPAPSSPALPTPGLPFTSRESEVPPEASPFPRARTLPMPGLYPAPATPFGPPSEETGPMPQAMPFAPQVGAPQGRTIGEMIPAARASSQGMTIGEMVAQQRLPIVPPSSPLDPGVPDSTQDALPPLESPAPPAEPPRIGPLATPEMVASDLAPPSSAPPPSDEAPEEPPPPPPAPPEPEPLPVQKYPLERCARIAASLARSRDKKAEILDAQELDAARWEPLRTHWLDEIKKDTERGKTDKLKAYDAAFVAQLEEERGPIAVEEYARIVISAERGTTKATLEELKLPEGAMLRIQRVWMAKMSKDPELRRLVQSAVEAASES